tara:strand:+ start:1554 stop:3404 length:1851 start_codon:yes stop_codon:yes gene_type:complete
MKDRLLNIQLTNEVQPKVREINGLEWVQYGDGEYRNNYPQYLVDLYNNSATHAAVVNATAAMIAGEDLLAEENDDLSQYVELKKFLGAINGKETAHDIFTKVAFDLKLQGSFALNVIYSKDRSKIAEVHHIPVEQLRVGTPDENGIVRDYYISADWAQYRKKEYTPRRVAAFNANDRREGSQILYTGLYSPAMELYHTPDYVAATNWVQVDNLTSDFHLNNIANGFSGSYFINFSNGIPTQIEREQIERQITQKFTGANNAGKFVLTFSDDANSRPEIVPIQVSNADKQYTVLNELCIQNIMIGHRVTSPMLLGVKTEGSLGGRNELIQAYELYMNTVVKPYQNTILRTFKRLLAVNGVVVPFGVKDTQPLNSLFGADVLKDVLTQDEIREEAGYAPLETGEQSVTEEVKMSSDNILDDLIDLYGEDENLEEWELIDEDDATDEHEDFDFQYNIEKLELASTGRAIPNAKSEQDGVSTQTHKTKYRVRYVYTTEKTFNNPNEGLPSREFCNKMVNAKKIYRKEDIIRMGSQAVNKGWGLRGADTYSIWKFKGGGDCRHKWFRRIYIQAGDKATRDDRVITTTKARSRGFKPQVNEQEVSVAPKNMDNRGFVTKKIS